jgi:hypothetical protein
MECSHPKSSVLAIVLAATVVAGGNGATAQTGPAVPPTLITPDKVETRIGPLQFKDGAPSVETAQKIADTLDFTRGLDAFLNSYGGASAYAIRQGLLSIGAEDNTVTIYPELMDSKSLYLTANADTVYYFSIVDLTKGPMVAEQPPNGLGTTSTLDFPTLTAAKAGNISCCRRAMTDQFRTGVFT